MSLLIVGMDNTIVNIGLRSIKDDLHTSISDLQWTIDAYTVVIASLMLLAGSTGDRVGRRTIFQLGLVVFTLSSLLCSLAPSLGWLVAFRALQAVGGSMLNPVALAIITNVFTEGRERARMIGIWGGVFGLTLGLGPIVGGALIDSLGWRAIFWINIPIGIAALVLTAIFVPQSRAARARRADLVGQVLVALFLGGLTFAIIEAPRAGVISARPGGALLIAILALVVLLVYEPRRVDPLIELRAFRNIQFSGAVLIAIFSFSAFSGFLFLASLYLQEVRGLGPMNAGYTLLPIAVGTIVLGPIAGRLVASRGPRLPLLLAGALMFIGALLLVPISATEPLVVIIASFTVFAAGFGLLNPPITNSAVSGMPREQAGVAAAIASTSRQVGVTLGVAVVGSVLAAGVSGPLSRGFVAASHVAWGVVTVCGAAVLALAAGTTRSWAVPGAQDDVVTPASSQASLSKRSTSSAGRLFGIR